MQDKVVEIQTGAMRGAAPTCKRCSYHYNRYMTMKQELNRVGLLLDHLTTTVQNLLKLDKTSVILFRDMIKKLIKNPRAYMRTPRKIIQKEIQEVTKHVYIAEVSEVGDSTWREYRDICKSKYMTLMLTRYKNADSFCKATGVSAPLYYKAKRKMKAEKT